MICGWCFERPCAKHCRRRALAHPVPRGWFTWVLNKGVCLVLDPMETVWQSGQ